MFKTSAKDAHVLGIIFVLGYTLASAFSLIFVSNIEQNLNQLRLVLYSFLIATIFFNIINFRDIANTYKIIVNNKRLIFLLNLTTAITWIATYYSVKYLEPSEFLAIVLGIFPLVTILITKRTGLSKLKPLDWVLSIAVFLSVVSIAYYAIYTAYQSASPELPHVILSVLVSLVAGVAAAHNNVYAKLISINGASPANILSFRFYLIIAIAWGLLLFEPVQLLIPWGLINTMFAVAFIAVVIPLYLLQVGIKFTDPVTISFVIPFLPVIAFSLQLADPRIHFSLPLLVLTIILSTFIFLAALYRAISGAKRQ